MGIPCSARNESGRARVLGQPVAFKRLQDFKEQVCGWLQQQAFRSKGYEYCFRIQFESGKLQEENERGAVELVRDDFDHGFDGFLGWEGFTGNGGKGVVDYGGEI